MNICYAPWKNSQITFKKIMNIKIKDLKYIIAQKLNENNKKIKFYDECTDAYSGQMNMECGVYENDEIVGYVEYVLFDDELTVSNIFVHPDRRREGFGSMLMSYIKREHPEYKYKPSYKTELGSQFKQKNITESKQVGLLYHYTSDNGLRGIKSQNFLRCGAESLNHQWVYFISFTRDKNFHKQKNHLNNKMEYRITLDGDKLSHKYKIQPMAYDPGDPIAVLSKYDDEETIRNLRNRTGEYDEKEERIVFKDGNGGIPNISNYILAIDKL